MIEISERIARPVCNDLLREILCKCRKHQFAVASVHALFQWNAAECQITPKSTGIHAAHCNVPQDDLRCLRHEQHARVLTVTQHHEAVPHVWSRIAMDEHGAESIIRSLMYRQTIRSRFCCKDAKTHGAAHEFTTPLVGAMQHPHRCLM